MIQSKIQVESETYMADFHASDVNEVLLDQIAREYETGGDGGIDLTVTYDPRHKDNTAMSATRTAAMIAKSLRDGGVDHVATEILPAWKSGAVSEVFFRFEKYTAYGPEGCEDMPGLYDDNASLSQEYKLGCGVQEMMARQVSHPKDLLGRADRNLDADARRATAVVEGYASGTPPETLNGEQASE